MLRFVEMDRRIFPFLFALILLCSGAFAQDAEERVLTLYNQAQTAHERGELLKAIELYREVIKLAPDRFEPKYQCATACLATGKPEMEREAVSLLKEVTTLKPDFARGYAALGTALMRVEDRAGAESALRHAITLDDKLSTARAQLAELLLARRAYKEAEAELKSLIAQGKADERSYLALGIAEQEQGRAEDALASYSRAVELGGRDREALYRRGKLYFQQKNYSAAIADLKPAYEASADAEIGVMLAESYAESGQKQPAIDLARALLAKATAPELRVALVDLLARLGANDLAATELERLLRAEPGNVGYLVRLGELYSATEPEKAVEYWQKAVTLDPKASNLVGLGSALLRAQRFEEAVHHFSTALAKDANYYEAHAGLGLAQFKLDRFAQAAQEFIWMIRARPENAINYYFLGICFDRLEDYTQALKAYELFLKYADAKINQLEIDKVQLRLPILRRQLEKQHGSKKR